MEIQTCGDWKVVCQHPVRVTCLKECSVSIQAQRWCPGKNTISQLNTDSIYLKSNAGIRQQLKVLDLEPDETCLSKHQTEDFGHTVGSFAYIPGIWTFTDST